MAASPNDYFAKVGNPGSATTLAAPGHSIGGTTFNVGSTAAWSTDTGIVFAVDQYTMQTVNGVQTAVRTPGTYTEWEGVVASSTQISGGIIRFGTDQNYPAGATTRVYIPVASSRENRLVDGLLVQHNQDGTHGALTATSVNTTTVTTDTISEKTTNNGVTIDGLSIKDNKLNSDGSVIPSNLLTGTGSSWAWQTYSPTLTNITIGNGTVTAKYSQIGKKVNVQFALVFGSTTAVTGDISISLPVTAATTGGSAVQLGGVNLFDFSVPRVFHGIVSQASTSTANIRPEAADLTYLYSTTASSTVPFTWAVSDEIGTTFSYQAA